MADEKGKSSKSAPVFAKVGRLGEPGKGIYGMLFKTGYAINDWLVPVIEKCIGNYNFCIFNPASTHRPMDVQWMSGCYVLLTCQNMF